MIGMRARAYYYCTTALKVVNDVTKKQFIVSMKGAEASLSYELAGKTITFVRTDVPDEFRGKGVGGLLAKSAFDHALEKNYDVVCQCNFLCKFYQNNMPRYKKLNIQMDLKDESN